MDALLVLLEQVVVLDLVAVLGVVEGHQAGRSLEPGLDQLEQARALQRLLERVF